MNLVEASLYFIAVCLSGLVLLAFFEFDGSTSNWLLIPLLLFAYLCAYNLFQYCDNTPRIVFTPDGIKVRSEFIPKTRIENIRVSLNRKIPTLSVSEKVNIIEATISAHDLDTPMQTLSEIAAVFMRRWKIEDTLHEEHSPGRYQQ